MLDIYERARLLRCELDHICQIFDLEGDDVVGYLSVGHDRVLPGGCVGRWWSKAKGQSRAAGLISLLYM